tara:strand:+ start:269 stop:406 length:138 start_codon:yes stop_codon:yes gene_type:complete
MAPHHIDIENAHATTPKALSPLPPSASDASEQDKKMAAVQQACRP